MNSERWEKVQELFHQALEYPPSERLSFLESATAGDEQLLSESQALLDADVTGSLLDQGMPQVAAQMFAVGTAPDIPIQAFGPYHLLSLLGEGGMGVVYLAERDDLGSLAAIKLLRDAWISKARRERFATEQKTLAQLTHPFIARLYDADTLADGTPWFAMEFVEGVPLAEYCQQHQNSIEERLKLLRSFCEAVRYAHSRAVIHRDLKPSNILVQADGTVKLLDFGIAKQLDQLDNPDDRTRTGLQLMTPAYAAPEQIRGEQPGTYTDVYALGVILYGLLTGHMPFDLSHCSPGEAETMIVHQEPEKPSTSASGKAGGLGVPRANNASWADLDVLCLTAMHKDPERRYRSVDSLLRDIDRYLANEPLEARPDSAGYKAQKFLQRNRRAVLSVVLSAAAVAGLVLFYTFRLAAARNEAVAQTARTRQVLQFTLNLFDGGDKQAGPSSDLRATTLVDRGAVQAASLSRDPEVQAELNETLGQIYQKLGKLDRADSLLTSSLQQQRSTFGANNVQVADSLVKLGLLRLSQAKLEEAEHLVRDGLAMSQRNLPAGDPAIAAAMHALGKVQEERGAYDQAIQTLKEAIRLRSNPATEKADLADSLSELANTYFYADRFSESEALNQRLLTMHRQLYGERHPLVANDLVNLGAIQQNLGNYPAAESLQRRALTIYKGFYGKDHFETASSLTAVARAIIPQKRYAEAEDLLKQALAIREQTFGKIHSLTASTLNELGNVANSEGHFEVAEADLQEVVNIYRAVYAGKHYLIGIALANLGSVYLNRKDYTRAEQLFRESLNMYIQTLAPGSINEAIVHVKLGRTLLREKHIAEAEKESLTGYKILKKQANPSVSFISAARQDLAAIYTKLQEPEKAKEFQVKQNP
jgi:eukaryotic-like serine/threonine-protein kinase